MTAFPFDLIGFDLDGTLADTGLDLANAVNHVLVSVGRAPLPEPTIRSFVGRGLRRTLERSFAAEGIDEPALIDRLLPTMIEHYGDNIAVHSRPYPGLVAVLDTLAGQGVRLAVCTNKVERLARALLDQIGLSRYFETVIGGDTLGGPMKPDPAPLAAMIERSGGGRTLFVGDSDADLGAARAAGLPCILCDFGYTAGDVRALGADAVIGHYDEFMTVLAEWPN
jgi:phosphoglycolate phosphatase